MTGVQEEITVAQWHAGNAGQKKEKDEGGKPAALLDRSQRSLSGNGQTNASRRGNS